MNEEWRAMPGYGGFYQVSDLGRVRSLDRIDGNGRKRAGRILSQAKVKGYLQVCLCLNGRNKKYYTHTLVLLLFCGKCPPGMEGNHKDGNKHRNCIGNLEYKTPSGNMLHSYDTGLHIGMKGESNPISKLDALKVIKIRELGASGEMSNSEIGALFGISRATVRDVIIRRSWKHVE